MASSEEVWAQGWSEPNAGSDLASLGTKGTIEGDQMIVNGQKGVVRQYPIVGGIDYAGVVAKSSSPLWKEGDAVVLTGNKAGQYFDGGYAERMWVPDENYLSSLEGLDPYAAAPLACGGLTAYRAVDHGLSTLRDRGQGCGERGAHDHPASAAAVGGAAFGCSGSTS